MTAMILPRTGVAETRLDTSVIDEWSRGHAAHAMLRDTMAAAFGNNTTGKR
jgi:2-phospho-L-lactate guanylyltransferase (CobY/MobA/RfbA family)